jgi:hypothetical protein
MGTEAVNWGFAFDILEAPVEAVDVDIADETDGQGLGLG